MKQILENDETTGSEFLASGVNSAVLLDAHNGGTWILQIESPDGNWIDTDITFDSNGVKDFSTIAGVAYRVHGGTAGAKAYVSDAL